VAAAAEVVGPDAGTLIEDPETGESQYSGVFGPIATKVASAPGMKQLKGGSGGTILHLNILPVLGKNKLVVWAKTRAAFATAARCEPWPQAHQHQLHSRHEGDQHAAPNKAQPGPFSCNVLLLTLVAV